ncbi:hypothetical protein BDZ88DRAFT_320291 [Geranomyces variabilis]|nr:hypothetical protein BDZ88DRAFT_320291 [Geranomyces variabilis]
MVCGLHRRDLQAAMLTVRHQCTISEAAYQAEEAGVQHGHILAEAARTADTLRAPRADARNEGGLPTRDSGMALATPSGLAAAALAAFTARDEEKDTALPSGTTIEEMLLREALKHDAEEQLAHSWVVDLEDAWVRGLPRGDRDAIIGLWNAGRTSSQQLESISRSLGSNDALRRCEEQLSEMEALFAESGADARRLYVALASQPDIRPDELDNAEVLQVVFDLRATLKAVLSAYVKEGPVGITNEASTFARLWDVVFGTMTASGLRTTAADETIEASKYRKLLTYPDRHNVRGLQSDKAWVTTTGEVVAWGEGKVGSWIKSWREADGARLKAIKGSKDCATLTCAKTGKCLEAFAPTWLGCDWEAYATIMLPSGACITGTLFGLQMPTNVDGFPRLSQVLRHVIVWNHVLEQHACELARTTSAKRPPPSLLSAASPKEPKSR